MLGALVWVEEGWASAGVADDVGAWVAEEGAVWTAPAAWAKAGTAVRSPFAAAALIRATLRDLILTLTDKDAPTKGLTEAALRHVRPSALRNCNVFSSTAGGGAENTPGRRRLRSRRMALTDKALIFEEPRERGNMPAALSATARVDVANWGRRPGLALRTRERVNLVH